MLSSRFLVAIILFLSVAVIFPAHAENDSRVEVEEQTSATMEVAPTIKRLSLDPGEIKYDMITVNNHSDDELIVLVYAAPIIDKGFEDESSSGVDEKFTQISRWILFQSENDDYLEKVEYTIKPHEKKDITYKISIPNSVASGGQYANLFVESYSKEESIQTTSRIGIPMYATVKGETTKFVIIKNVNTKRIIIGDKIRIDATVINDGNIDFQSTIEMTVSSIFGKTIHHDSAIITMLPGNNKQITAKWENIPVYGLFHLAYNIKALDTNTGEEYLILIVPEWMLVVIVVSLSGLVAIIIYYFKKHKSRKNAIIM